MPMPKIGTVDIAHGPMEYPLQIVLINLANDKFPALFLMVVGDRYG